MKRLCPPFLLVLALIALLTPISASAASSQNPNADCNAHSALTQHYTASQLKHALATMPADESEYTDCPDVIRRALNQALGTSVGGGGSGGGGGSSFPAWVIVVIVVVILGGATATIVARRRQQETDSEAPTEIREPDEE